MTAWVTGQVQGVGFRWWTRARALELGLVGSATNLGDGRVKIVAEGAEEALRLMLGHLEGGATPGVVGSVRHQWGDASGRYVGFAER
jgi:acylphosphatase